MADGNRSAKGKEVVVIDGVRDYPADSPADGGSEPSHRWLGHPASYWTVGGAPTAEPFVGPYDSGYFSYGAAGGSWIGGVGAIPAGAVGWDAAAAGTNGGSGSYGVLGGAAGAVGWDGAAAAATSGGGGSGSYLAGDGAAAASYGGSRTVDRRGDGYGGMGFLPQNGGGGSAFFPPTHGMDPRVYAQAPQRYASPGYWPNANVNGGASFPSPFTGAAGTPGPQHPGPGGYRPAGNGVVGSSVPPFPSAPFTSGAERELYRDGNGNASGNGGGAATFPSPSPHPHMGDGMYYAVPYPYHAGPPHGSPPVPRYSDQLNTLVEYSLRSLSIHDRGERLLARGRRHLYDLVVGHNGRPQQPPPPQQQLNAGGGNLPQSAPIPAAADPYAGRRLEDVRGAMGSVARSLAGCQFLIRMVAEGGAAAAQEVFEEVAGDVVRLMVDAVAHELVEKLVEYWTDEEIARVLQILAASPDHVVAVARDHAGSNILQTLVSRMAGNPGHAELFTSTLARVGEHGVVSLIEHPDGSRLILKCLDTFSAYQNRFITAVVSNSLFLNLFCRDKHGCNVVNRCIDKAAGDEQLLDSLVSAVCSDGIALAEHGYGNFVVQHVMSSVPEARGFLHELFRGRYVSLSRQAASSHVVQNCLELFSPEQADEIVGELLGCHRWDCTFRQLITDPYANYVLQSAMKRGGIQMHYPLLNAIGTHRNSLQDDRIAREVFRTLRKVIAGID
ncbi:unnamed protein product [Urochloa humidicola]